MRRIEFQNTKEYKENLFLLSNKKAKIDEDDFIDKVSDSAGLIFNRVENDKRVYNNDSYISFVPSDFLADMKEMQKEREKSLKISEFSSDEEELCYNGFSESDTRRSAQDIFNQFKTLSLAKLDFQYRKHLEQKQFEKIAEKILILTNTDKKNQKEAIYKGLVEPLVGEIIEQTVEQCEKRLFICKTINSYNEKKIESTLKYLEKESVKEKERKVMNEVMEDLKGCIKQNQNVIAKDKLYIEMYKESPHQAWAILTGLINGQDRFTERPKASNTETEACTRMMDIWDLFTVKTGASPSVSPTGFQEHEEDDWSNAIEQKGSQTSG